MMSIFGIEGICMQIWGTLEPLGYIHTYIYIYIYIFLYIYIYIYILIMYISISRPRVCVPSVERFIGQGVWSWQVPIASGHTLNGIWGQCPSMLLRVQSTQIWSIYGFCFRNIDYDLGSAIFASGIQHGRTQRLHVGLSLAPQVPT